MFLHQLFQAKSATTINSYTQFQEGFPNVKKMSNRSLRQNEAVNRMNNLLTRKVKNKKCYCFQVLKQFIIFPDSSYNSSYLSVSKYDPLIFSDQKIHSLQKIMQTQLFERKIWAFINLKMHHRQQQIKELAQKSEFAIKKMCFFQKKQSFRFIKQMSKRTQRQSNLQKHVMFNFSIINNSKNLESDEKMPKFQQNASKRTIQSDKEGASALKSMMEMRSFAQSCCQGCSCHYSCCCCSSKYNYNLDVRIQYLKRLEQLVSLREKNPLYR